MKDIKIFKLKPTKWWLCLNPKWWKYKGVVERMVSQNVIYHEPKIMGAIKDTIMNGTGAFLIKMENLTKEDRIPDDAKVKCEDCEWVGLVKDCGVGQDQDGYENPVYDTMTCPKCESNAILVY